MFLVLLVPQKSMDEYFIAALKLASKEETVMSVSI